MNNDWTLAAIVAFPFLGAALIALRSPARLTALLSAAAVLALTLVQAAEGTGRMLKHQIGFDWLDAAGVKIVFGLGVDGVSLPLLLLSAVVGVAAVLVSPVSPAREREYYGYLLLILGGALGAFLATDLFFLYAFHEVALIPTFLMIGIWGRGSRRVNAAWTMALYLMAGSMVLLLGLLALLYALPAGQRTTDLVALQGLWQQGFQLPLEQQTLILGLLGVGFGILVGLFPFHSWAPQSYSAAPTPVAMLHAGVLKKFGIYGLLRLAVLMCPNALSSLAPVAAWFIAGNLLVMAWVTIAQKRLDDALGNASVMHMGYLFLGLLAATSGSLVGVVLLMVGHGLSVAGLFAVNGLVDQRAGTVEVSKLGGLAQKVPFVAFCFSFFTMASIGLPGLANFPGEAMIFLGSFGRHPELTAVAVLGVVFSAVYMLRLVKGVFQGPFTAVEWKEVGITLSERGGLLLLMAALLVFGVMPNLLARGANASLAEWLGGLWR